jgi:hypothetical protein
MVAMVVRAKQRLCACVCFQCACALLFEVVSLSPIELITYCTYCPERVLWGDLKSLERIFSTFSVFKLSTKNKVTAFVLWLHLLPLLSVLGNAESVWHS